MGRSVAGINASSVSQRATDLEMKIRYMDEITGNRGCILSTGTPFNRTIKYSDCKKFKAVYFIDRLKYYLLF